MHAMQHPETRYPVLRHSQSCPVPVSNCFWSKTAEERTTANDDFIYSAKHLRRQVSREAKTISWRLIIMRRVCCSFNVRLQQWNWSGDKSWTTMDWLLPVQCWPIQLITPLAHQFRQDRSRRWGTHQFPWRYVPEVFYMGIPDSYCMMMSGRGRQREAAGRCKGPQDMR